MKLHHVIAAAAILVAALNPAHAGGRQWLAAYECRHADQHGFGCEISGRTDPVMTLTFSGDPTDAQQYQRLLLIYRFLDAGGASVREIHTGRKMQRSCPRLSGRLDFHCFEWTAL